MRKNLVILCILLLNACAPRHPVDFSDPAVQQSLESQKQRLNIEALSKITLPAHPTKQEVRAYIDEIQSASRSQNSFLSSDPQITMLMAVGHENLDVLIQATSGYVYYIVEAINALAIEGDKDMILANLNAHPPLVNVVMDKGWVKDARETLVARLRTNPENLPPAWIEAVASFQDPTTYDELLNYLMNGSNSHLTYRYIAHLPGIDLSTAVPVAWEKTQNNNYERVQLTEGALAVGYLPALDFVVENLETGKVGPYQLNARALFFQFTGVQGSNEELKQWYKDNRKMLQFDEKTRRFVPRKTYAVRALVDHRG